MYLSEELVGKHEGAIIGVLGSGPTLNDFKDKVNSLCDIVIACNGSVNVLNPNEHYVDYFMYYDGYSFKRDWFYKSRDFYQRPTINLPILDFFTRKKTARISGCEPCESEMQDEMYYYNVRKLKYNSSFGFTKGLIYNWCTVTGLATQMAFHMGAKQINLFGSSFDNDYGRKYAYIPEKNDIGSTYNHQRIAMDRVLFKIKQKGVEVISYGETRLQEPKIVTSIFSQREIQKLGYKI